MPDASGAADEGKTQNIRLLDVFFIGPLLVWVGFAGRLNDTVRILLFVIGVATVIYNGRNFIRITNDGETVTT